MGAGFIQVRAQNICTHIRLIRPSTSQIRIHIDSLAGLNRNKEAVDPSQ